MERQDRDPLARTEAGGQLAQERVHCAELVVQGDAERLKDPARRAVGGAGTTGNPLHPGGQAILRPASTWRWMWNTVCPASALQLNTVR